MERFLPVLLDLAAVLFVIVYIRSAARRGFVRTLVQLFGGQGTINVNSWSPDSRCFAFVSYRIREE